MIDGDVLRLRLPIRLACVALLLAACGDSTGAAKSGAKTDEIDAVPFPSTIELDDVGLAGLDRSEDDGTLHFSTVPAALAKVRIGRILVAGVGKHTPAGLLRAVLAVERNDDGRGLTLRTAQV